MNNDDFQHFLKRQPMRRIPPHWRAEILASAEPAPASKTSGETPWWLSWLWPSPVAWAGVACAWLLAVGLNNASRPSVSEIATLSSISPREIAEALVWQQRVITELFRPEDHREISLEPMRRQPSPGAFNDHALRMKTTIV
jgi:hypothetical protein